MMTDINIHIVGIGNLGMSFLEGFKSLKDGTSFYLYENNKEIIKNLESSYSVTTDIDQIDNGVLLLCIKPNNLNEFINVNKSKISDQVLIATRNQLLVALALAIALVFNINMFFSSLIADAIICYY